MGGLTAPCLARRGLERGLGGLFRRLDEWTLVVAGNSAPRTSSTCAATGNCANKVAVLLGLPGQDVLAVNSTQLHEESVQSVEGKLRRGAHAVEFRDGGVLVAGGAVLAAPAFFHGVHQEDDSDVVAQARVENRQLLSRPGEVVEKLPEASQCQSGERGKILHDMPMPRRKLERGQEGERLHGVVLHLVALNVLGHAVTKVAFEKSLKVRRR